MILGVFVADTAYRAERAPRRGETIIGNSFALGPGGKGSNQAVAAAKLGAYGTLPVETWARSLRGHGAQDLGGRRCDTRGDPKR